MASNELIAYVADRRKAGMSDNRIETILHNTGYAPLEIEEALRGAGPSPTPVVEVAPVAPVSTTPSVSSTTATATASTSAATPKGRFAQEDIMGDLERSRKIKKIVFSVIGGVLVAGIAYGAYVVFGPPSPQKVIAKMLNDGFANIHSLEVGTELSVNVDVSAEAVHADAGGVPGDANPALGYADMALGNGSSSFSLNVNASTSYDGTDKADPAFDTMGTVAIGATVQGQSFTFTAGGETRVVSSTLYAEITKMPQLGALLDSFIGTSDLSQFENKWVSAPLTTSTADQFGAGQLPVALGTSTISSSSLASITSALQGAVQIVKTLPGQTLDGTPTYHYQYMVTKPGLENLAATLETIAQVSSTARTESVANLTNALASVQGMGGEIWIGTKDYYPRQISFALSFATTTAQGYAASGTVAFTTSYSGINAPQDISAPADAESIDQFLSSFMAPPSPGNQNVSVLRPGK